MCIERCMHGLAGGVGKRASAPRPAPTQLDYTGRLFREGKAVISAELIGILERLGSSAEHWQARLRKLARGRLLGRFLAATRSRLREVPSAWACVA